ncbi:hypothetical protein HanRHA438_Chr13g0604141 [Helianthus annuus]|uniref:Uncharacterized protein n=1 Tax=Helianthus annuus TaxID=4232 RepID=A0A9K3EHN1_HELAN|nr:hypothetical protein HanXRQr2_Chr13g0593521 [Helianthus annuus]KAJ0477295.1 hypothetical protein HanHA300_Chr13g0486801 [Helianthus annuus]KAJ0481709.1 hypothetical protein HanIR_Chr13g0645651 [Helianthus annuus]KAJ0498128.1 hypothetical protein HanHA89_Chr13g0518941 [Helianthus annuus]KAJ0664130.1 hypothetical protein HanLR1_Chr13g0488791 [Helianthus annuus]
MRQSGWDHSTLQYTERKQVLGLETEIRMLKSLDLQSLARLRWVSHSD